MSWSFGSCGGAPGWPGPCWDWFPGMPSSRMRSTSPTLPDGATVLPSASVNPPGSVLSSATRALSGSFGIAPAGNGSAPSVVPSGGSFGARASARTTA